MYSLPTEDRGQQFDVPAQLEGLPDMKPEDQQYFGALLKVCLSCSTCYVIPLGVRLPQSQPTDALLPRQRHSMLNFVTCLVSALYARSVYLSRMLIFKA